MRGLIRSTALATWIVLCLAVAGCDSTNRSGGLTGGTFNGGALGGAGQTGGSGLGSAGGGLGGLSGGSGNLAICRQFAPVGREYALELEGVSHDASRYAEAASLVRAAAGRASGDLATALSALGADLGAASSQVSSGLGIDLTSRLVTDTDGVFSACAESLLP
jgi:hypothetical protein